MKIMKKKDLNQTRVEPSIQDDLKMLSFCKLLDEHNTKGSHT